MKNVCGAMVKLEVTDPNVTGLGQGGTVGMFAGSGLQALSLEHVAEVGALTFLDCSHLKEVRYVRVVRTMNQGMMKRGMKSTFTKLSGVRAEGEKEE